MRVLTLFAAPVHGAQGLATCFTFLLFACVTVTLWLVICCFMSDMCDNVSPLGVEPLLSVLPADLAGTIACRIEGGLHSSWTFEAMMCCSFGDVWGSLVVCMSGNLCGHPMAPKGPLLPLGPKPNSPDVLFCEHTLYTITIL